MNWKADGNLDLVTTVVPLLNLFLPPPSYQPPPPHSFLALDIHDLFNLEDGTVYVGVRRDGTWKTKNFTKKQIFRVKNVNLALLPPVTVFQTEPLSFLILTSYTINNNITCPLHDAIINVPLGKHFVKYTKRVLHGKRKKKSERERGREGQSERGKDLNLIYRLNERKYRNGETGKLTLQRCEEQVQT